MAQLFLNARDTFETVLLRYVIIAFIVGEMFVLD